MSSTILLDSTEERRQWKALTRCCDSTGDRPMLSNVLFDGTYAYATDTRVLGVLEAPVSLPEQDDDEPRRVIVPAKLLRDALGLAAGKEPVRLVFRPGALRVVLGADPLPLGDEYAAPEVTIPYGDQESFPETEWFTDLLDPDASTRRAAAADAGELASRLGVNAHSLSLLAALASSDGSDPLVTMHPRPGSDLVDVRHARLEGVRLGVMTRVRSMEEFRQVEDAA